MKLLIVMWNLYTVAKSVTNVLVQNLVTYLYRKSHTVSSVIAVKQEAKYKCVQILFLCYIIY